MIEEPQTPPPAPSLQDTVLHLQWFWAAQGCLLLPTCDFEVPFAALHPDAFFRILHPDPWRAAYLQPVRRPLDGRYGKHPHRLGKHLQLQVVLKPPPADVQGLYLESLEALGLDLELHDVRFAEGCWRPRSLGASGSGWHVLLDGLGVTRLTFLERIADRELDPACVEISYGLERLVMTLQGAASAFELGGSEGGGEADYGQQRQREEEEISRYAFEVADVAGLERRLEALDGEAVRCLEAGLARPAYELAVRCLELIDLLDARGELPARERVRLLEGVREKIVAIAELDLANAPAPEVVGTEAVDAVAGEAESAAAEEPKKRRKTKRRQPAKGARPKGRSGALDDGGADAG